MKKIEEQYSILQTLWYFKRKYSQKIDKEKLETILSKAWKDFSYLKLEKESKLIDIMKQIHQENVEFFAKAMVIILKNKNDKLTNTKVEELIQDYKKDLELVIKYNKESNEDILKQFQSKLTHLLWKKRFIDVIKHLRGKEKILSDDQLYEILFNLEDNNLDNITEKEFKEKMKEIFDMLGYYQIVRKFYKTYGYVLTPKENVIIQDILEQLENWKVVALLWETWSGKTELARFICKAFLKKDPIMVSWSKYLTDEDFTIEKTVTSKSILDDWKLKQQQSWLTKEEFLNNAVQDTFDKILKSEEFKKSLKEKLKKEWKTDQEAEQEIEKIDLWYNLFTEHHLKWLFKWMVEWRLVIIDEANLIRPEVIMALNDYLTRRVWDEIELPNGLGKIKIKKWFNIILTWNDPEAYSLKKRYKSWRYNFDEATYNRLSVYQKDYYKQVDRKFEDSSQNENDVFKHMNDNQLYTILLMMIFDHKKNPYGIEISKENFSWLTDNGKKEKIFKDIHKLALATKYIQKAFAWEVVNILKLWADISVHNEINKKVISMRNLKEILDAYIKWSKSIEYYIYKHFVSQTWNKDEKYALLAIFHEVWLFQNFVWDDKDETFDTLEKWYLSQKDKKLSALWKEKKTVPKNKVIINKYDLMKWIFGKKSFFDTKEDEKFQELFSNIDTEDKSVFNNVSQNEELSEEELRTTLKNILSILPENYNSIQSYLINWRIEEFNKLAKQEKYKDIANILHKARKNKTDNVKELEKVFKEYLAEIKKINEEYEKRKKKLTVIISYLEQDEKVDSLTQEELDSIKPCFDELVVNLW